MRLSTKGRYGVLAMYELACRYGNGPVSIKEIAEKQNFSDSYMEQLFSTLKKAGLIVSLRGALEGPIELADCVGGPEGYVCRKSGECVTKGLWMEIRDSINNIIDNRSLQDLMDN